MPLHIHTPLIESAPLSRAAGRPVWLKLEALQPPGSFKIRGIGAACEHYAQLGAKRFVSSSGGNAGLAVAYAGRHLKLPVTVVVPETTSERARQLLRLEGADVIVHGASWQEANALAQSLLTATDAFLHPFDNPLLWTGHATMIDEVAAAGNKPDAVLLAVGGGGLLAGVMEGLARNGWGDVPVLAVETQGAASLHAAMQAGQPTALDAVTSIATSLGARQVCAKALPSRPWISSRFSVPVTASNPVANTIMSTSYSPALVLKPVGVRATSCSSRRSTNETLSRLNVS